jgi:hypothetical protein
MNFDSNSASQLQNDRANSAFSSFYLNTWVPVNVQNSSFTIPYLFPVKILDSSFFNGTGLDKPRIVLHTPAIRDFNISFVPQQSGSVTSVLKNASPLFFGIEKDDSESFFPNYSFPIQKEKTNIDHVKQSK